MTDYSKTIIYKIVCNNLSIKECYVGHTINMTKRKCCHKSCCHNEIDKGHNNKIYQMIRQNGGWSNWSMLLIEKFPCKDKHEACKREREIYEEIDAKMNMLRPYRTQEDLKNYQKQYREENKDYQKKWREAHKEEIEQNKKQYYQEHKENYKKYYQDHKEERKQYEKKYREEKKEEMNEKIECEFCKKTLSKCSMYRHLKICKCKE